MSAHMRAGAGLWGQNSGGLPVMVVQAQRKQQLRRYLRQLRGGLTDSQRQLAAIRLRRTVASHPLWLRSRHVAAYLAVDGEIDTMPLIRLAWQQGKSVYLPVLDSAGLGRLVFLPWRLGMELVNNRFGIPEPVLISRCRLRPPLALDLVLLPLTAFDRHGRRMGMGGGFYDRTFALLKRRYGQVKPFLAGLAHECQRVRAVPMERWDVPLAAVFSDLRAY